MHFVACFHSPAGNTACRVFFGYTATVGLFTLKPPSGKVEWFTFADMRRVAQVQQATLEQAIKRVKVQPAIISNERHLYHREDAFRVLAELQRTVGRRAELATKSAQREHGKST